MASKTAHDNLSATPEAIEEMLDVLDTTLDRLKVLYEQYFLGIQKQAPAYLHSDVERKLRDLTQIQIRNTGLRYRYATLQQKFGSYNSYWRRTLRQIENGTYARNLSKIGRAAARSGEEIPEEILAAMPKRMREQVVRDRAQALAAEARRKAAKSGEVAEPETLELEGDEPPLVEEDAVAIISEPTELRRDLKSRSGAHVIDESDATMDLDSFFASVEQQKEAVKSSVRASAPISQTAPSETDVGVKPDPGAAADPSVKFASRPATDPGNKFVSPARAATDPGVKPGPARAATEPGPARAATDSESTRAATDPRPARAATEPGSARAATDPRSARAATDPVKAGPARAATEPGAKFVPRPATDPGVKPVVPGPARGGTEPGAKFVPRPATDPGVRPGPARAATDSGAKPAVPGPARAATDSGAKPAVPGPARAATDSGARPAVPARAATDSGAKPAAPGPARAATDPGAKFVPRPATDPGVRPVAPGPARAATDPGTKPVPPVSAPARAGTDPGAKPPSSVPGPDPAVRRPVMPTPAAGVGVVPKMPAAIGPKPLVPPPPVAARAATPSVPPVLPKVPPPVAKAPSQMTRPNPIVPVDSSPQPEPATARPAPVARAQPRPQPEAPMKPPPGMTDADVNALYAKYVSAKEMMGETVGPGGQAKLLKTINAQAPKIMEQYKAKAVDFSVVVKDNQVIIRAKPKL